MTSEFSAIPAKRFFEFVLVSRSDDCAEVTMPIKPNYLQEGGVVHGGIISALADTAAVYILYPGLPDGKNMTSVEFKVNFLSPGLIENGDLRAVARLVKRGSRVGLCDVEVFQQDLLLAKGLFTYLFFDVRD